MVDIVNALAGNFACRPEAGGKRVSAHVSLTHTAAEPAD